MPDLGSTENFYLFPSANHNTTSEPILASTALRTLLSYVNENLRKYAWTPLSLCPACLELGNCWDVFLVTIHVLFGLLTRQ